MRYFYRFNFSIQLRSWEIKALFKTEQISLSRDANRWQNSHSQSVTRKMSVEWSRGYLVKLTLTRSFLQVAPNRCGVYEAAGEDREHRACDRQSRHANHGREARVQAMGEQWFIHLSTSRVRVLFNLYKNLIPQLFSLVIGISNKINK